MDLILGTAQFAADYGQFRDRRQSSSVTRLLKTAQNNGFTVLDTAPAYQGAEEAIGQSAWQGGIHTKFGFAQPLTDSVSQSLKRLRRDAVDVIYFHDPAVLWLPGRYFHRARLGVKDRARLLGVSVYSPAELKRALAISAIQAIQLPVNLADGRFSRDLFAEAKEKGVKLFARSVLLQGALLQNAKDLPRYLAPISPILEAMRQIADVSGLTATHLAVGWAKSLPGVAGVIVGAEAESQLLEISQAFYSLNLSGDILALLASVQITSDDALDPRKWPAQIPKRGSRGRLRAT